MAQPQGGNKSQQWQIHLHKEEWPVTCSQWNHRWCFCLMSSNLDPCWATYAYLQLALFVQVRTSSFLWNWSTDPCWSWEGTMGSSATTRTPTHWMPVDPSMTSSPYSIAMEPTILKVILKVTQCSSFTGFWLVASLPHRFISVCYRCRRGVLVREQHRVGVHRWRGPWGLHFGAPGARSPRHQRQKWQILTWRPRRHA